MEGGKMTTRTGESISIKQSRKKKQIKKKVEEQKGETSQRDNWLLLAGEARAPFEGPSCFSEGDGVAGKKKKKEKKRVCYEVLAVIIFGWAEYTLCIYVTEQ